LYNVLVLLVGLGFICIGMFFLQLLITYFESHVHELALAEVNGGIFICHIFAYFEQNEYFYTIRLQKHKKCMFYSIFHYNSFYSDIPLWKLHNTTFNTFLQSILVNIFRINLQYEKNVYQFFIMK